MMCNISNKLYVSLLFLLVATFLLSSCGASRKATYGSRSSSGASNSGILTDASSARGKTLSGSKLDRYAELMGVSTRDLDNKTLYSFIDNWLGSPHRMGGLKKSGIDCSAFVGILYREVYGKNLPRSSRDMGENIKKRRESKLEEGDLVFFSFGGKNIDHVGVYLHNNKFVHVSTRKGVIISDMKDSWYNKYFVSSGTPKI